MDKQEMIRIIKDRVLPQLVWYNMGDFRQVFIGDIIERCKTLRQRPSVVCDKFYLSRYYPAIDINMLWLYICWTLWGDCSKPIDDQSTECIEFIYNLLG